MVPIRAVLFDCAETLLSVNWQADSFAMACAERAGIAMPPQAQSDYLDRLTQAYPQFLEMNRFGDPAKARTFYGELGSAWLASFGQNPQSVHSLLDAADELAYGPSSILFRLFNDVLPALETIRASGMRTAVVSNWDYSLPRVLDSFGLMDYFDVSVASLVEGVEKPDPELFLTALRRLGVGADEAVHIGDSPGDDVEGALAAGCEAVLIDRSLAPDLPRRISSMHQLPEVIACLG